MIYFKRRITLKIIAQIIDLINFSETNKINYTIIGFLLSVNDKI